MKFGLLERQIKEIIGVLKGAGEINEVVVFGSRAMGNFKRGSDVDLAIKGPVNKSLIARISGLLNEETTMPYKFDVINYNTISSPDLKKHIDEFGKTLYQSKKR